jgi:hypothetical protein
VAELTGFPNYYGNLSILAAPDQAVHPTRILLIRQRLLRKISSPLHSALIKKPLVCLTLCLNPRIASELPKILTLNTLVNSAPFRLFLRENLYNQLHKKLHRNLSTANSTLHPIVSRNPSGQRFNEDYTRRVFRYTSLALSVSRQRSCRH